MAARKEKRRERSIMDHIGRCMVLFVLSLYDVNGLRNDDACEGVMLFVNTDLNL